MELCNNFKYMVKNTKTTIKLIVAAAVIMLLTITVILNSYCENVNSSLANNLIRLHIIANSDSTEDQAIKREIRDKVLKHIEAQTIHSTDLEQTKCIVNQNIGEIKKISSEIIVLHGKDYKVDISLGSHEFPTKMYGDIVLPAGNYQAVRIIIGSGRGANWWCVLFPPLCFVDATHGTIPEFVKAELKTALSDEEYKLVTSSSSDKQIPIVIKFKIVEVFNSSKIKLSGLVNKIFKS